MDFTLNNLVDFGWIALYGAEKGWHAAVLFVGYFIAGAVAYLLGSLNFGIIISKYKFREDVRSFGSGNAGMTNMLRTYGKAAAVFTLLGDMAKSAASVIFGQLLCGLLGGYIAGLCCMIGHVWPLYYGFKGGKGVVVVGTTLLFLSPASFTIVFGMFVAIVAITKYISLGSIMGMLVFPLVLSRTTGNGLHILVAIIMAALVIWLHRGNIKRLRAGTENKLSFKKKDKKPADPPKTAENSSDEEKKG